RRQQSDEQDGALPLWCRRLRRPLRRRRERIRQVEPPLRDLVAHPLPIRRRGAPARGQLADRLTPEPRAAGARWTLDRVVDALDAGDVVGQHAGTVERAEDGAVAELAEAHVDLEELLAQLEEGPEAVPHEPVLAERRRERLDGVRDR